MNCSFCNGMDCKLWYRLNDYIPGNPTVFICAYCIVQKNKNKSLEKLGFKYIEPTIWGYGLYVDYGEPFYPAISNGRNGFYLYFDSRLSLDSWANLPQSAWDEWMAKPYEPTIYKFVLPPLLEALK